LLLLQVPPPVASVSVVDEPMHTAVAPLMLPATGAGDTFTTSVTVAVPQLLVTVYDIVVKPDETPVTTPVALMVAAAGLLLLHTPPDTASVRVMFRPMHTLAGPLMVPPTGEGFTVTALVAVAVPHLLVTEYVMVAGPPLTPVTTPVAPTLATAALLELHTPPAAASVRVLVVPWHNVVVPLMLPAAAAAPTVTP